VPDDLQQLRANIERFPKEVTARLRSVAFRTSREVMARAQALVPVDTGWTRDHIHIIEDAAHKQFLVSDGSDRPQVRIALHTSTRSGRMHTQKVTLNMLPNWIEYGTVKMRARPFMRPAADAVLPSYRAEMIAVATQTATELLK